MRIGQFSYNYYERDREGERGMAGWGRVIPCVATDEFTCSMLLEGIANLFGNYA